MKPGWRSKIEVSGDIVLRITQLFISACLSAHAKRETCSHVCGLGMEWRDLVPIFRSAIIPPEVDVGIGDERIFHAAFATVLANRLGRQLDHHMRLAWKPAEKLSFALKSSWTLLSRLTEFILLSLAFCNKAYGKLGNGCSIDLKYPLCT